MAKRGTRMRGRGKQARDRTRGRAARKHRSKRHREVALPGMEDHAIHPLEQGAQQYVDIRDRRMELNKEEVELKRSLLKLMKQHLPGKTMYRHGGVIIRVIAGEEDVKVKVVLLDEATDGAEPLDIQAAAPAPA